MLEFLALSTIWFWLLLFVVVAIITALVESEQGALATGALIGTVVILNYVLKIPIFKLLALHPWKTAAWVLVYFAAGVIWGLFKWYVFLHKKSAQYKEARDSFLKKNGASELTPALAARFLKELDNKYDSINDRGVSPNPPTASSHKGDIIRWMTYWPFSIIGTILNDFVRKAWIFIYNFMTQTYDRIAAHVFREYSADMDLAKQGAAENAAQKEQEVPPRRYNSY